jgi:hypothetical protein
MYTELQAEMVCGVRSYCHNVPWVYILGLAKLCPRDVTSQRVINTIETCRGLEISNYLYIYQLIFGRRLLN